MELSVSDAKSPPRFPALSALAVEPRVTISRWHSQASAPRKAEPGARALRHLPSPHRPHSQRKLMSAQVASLAARGRPSRPGLHHPTLQVLHKV